MEVMPAAAASSSPGPSTVDSAMSRDTSGSEGGVGSSAREWKRLFGQMQAGSTRMGARGGGGDAGRRGRGASRGGSAGRGGGVQRSMQHRQAGPSDSPGGALLALVPTSSSDALSRIRHKILTTPLPPDTVLSPTGTTYRSIVWKLLLDIGSLDIASYLSLVAKGKSPSHDKIRNDTFRTLATDQGFKERVKEEKLIRLLDAFVWKFNRAEEGDEPEADGVYEFSYVQGMNVLAAPFLYTCHSEVEAFRCFSRFIEYCCPLYVQPTLAGVHRGLQLLDRCLEILDAPLYTHLRSKNLSAEIYAFPSVMTLCACTPPLPEVLQLWDFLLAFGVHFNVLCIVAQLHIMRADLLDSTSPMKLLRHLPPLDARKIINVTVTLARDVPKDLFEELVRHPYHPDSVVGLT
ncbi:related to cell cycle arrest protein BUB2 [Sporisorium reilianum f. sp. reilianum]|uniref:Related to cell cycle arrest protein BUB2 n=1 Tax=Sporisorium reilianum f. sp. reilianum TaxID=72559 RepID=A0A2N8U7B7_9BASI|nr:related to cell cycle arrest protein BUB2 [Sporisorium reilianum f. sp. reilianum]